MLGLIDSKRSPSKRPVMTAAKSKAAVAKCNASMHEFDTELDAQADGLSDNDMLDRVCGELDVQQVLQGHRFASRGPEEVDGEVQRRSRGGPEEVNVRVCRAPNVRGKASRHVKSEVRREEMCPDYCVSAEKVNMSLTSNRLPSRSA